MGSLSEDGPCGWAQILIEGMQQRHTRCMHSLKALNYNPRCPRRCFTTGGASALVMLRAMLPFCSVQFKNTGTNRTQGVRIVGGTF